MCARTPARVEKIIVKGDSLTVVNSLKNLDYPFSWSINSMSQHNLFHLIVLIVYLFGSGRVDEWKK